jgi:hypothetical protein
VANETILQKTENEKMKKEKLAAIRSQQTNLNLLLAFLFIPILDFYYLNDFYKVAFVNVTLGSLQKCILPILTTIANFGTIREVSTQYWTILKSKFDQS